MFKKNINWLLIGHVSFNFITVSHFQYNNCNWNCFFYITMGWYQSLMLKLFYVLINDCKNNINMQIENVKWYQSWSKHSLQLYLFATNACDWNFTVCNMLYTKLQLWYQTLMAKIFTINVFSAENTIHNDYKYKNNIIKF